MIRTILTLSMKDPCNVMFTLSVRLYCMWRATRSMGCGLKMGKELHVTTKQTIQINNNPT